MAPVSQQGGGNGKPRGDKKERKLPVQQLCILAVCRFAEPIASTSVFPYLPEMVQSFGVEQDDVAKWAGLCAAVFSITQAVMGVPWGRASDRYGRKPAIILGLTTTLLTSLLWGFSTSLPMAIAARAIAGAGNGNVGIIRTTVAEMVPFKELQPRAFSLMPLVWNIGSVFGPSIGGTLANPLRITPEKRGTPGFTSVFAKYPYALPNLVAAVFFLVGIMVGILFLDETLETRRHRPDLGRIAGRWIARTAKRHVIKIEELVHLRKKEDRGLDVEEREPLIKKGLPSDDLENAGTEEKQLMPPPPGYKEVITKQAAINLVVYTLLAMHTMAYDQLLPVFMHYPPLCQTRDARTQCNEARWGNPLQFAGGFGLSNQSIGALQTAYGISGMLTQFFLFPPIARKFGVLKCLKVCAIVFPITYFLTPFTALLPTVQSQMAVNFVVMLFKGWCAIFAFPCSTILLTNSATSLRTLGTLNGFATSVSAVGRAAGPALAGATFTLGVQKGYVVVPWWFLTVIGALAALPCWLLVEGDGFGGDDDECEDEEEIEDDEAGLRGEALLDSVAGPSGETRPVGVPLTRAALSHEEEEEEAYGRIGQLLSRTTTASSAAVDDDNGSTPRTSRPPTRRNSSTRRVIRRTSMPLGTGSQGVARRFSGHLGQSLGSAGGFHGA